MRATETAIYEPNGKVLKRKSKNYPQNRINYKSSEKDCNLCPSKGKCISEKVLEQFPIMTVPLTEKPEVGMIQIMESLCRN